MNTFDTIFDKTSSDGSKRAIVQLWDDGTFRLSICTLNNDGSWRIGTVKNFKNSSTPVMHAKNSIMNADIRAFAIAR